MPDYSREQLFHLRPRACLLSDASRRLIHATGLRRVRSRPRGCRAGKRKQTSADRNASRQRHVNLPPRQLKFGTFNVCSLRNKVDGVQDILTDYDVDILCLTETWHEDIDDVPLRRLRTAGYQVLERARPPPSKLAETANTVDYINHGGVAIVAPTNIKVIKQPTQFEPTTFEVLCAKLSSCGASCMIAVIYRPGSDAKTEQFFTEFDKLLGYMSSFSSPFIITGDLNIRFDRPDDPATLRICDLLNAYGMSQHVDQSTHRLGGTLDVIITSNDCLPVSTDVDDPGLSDHNLVRWIFNLRTSSEPVYQERERRAWSTFDLESFRAALMRSDLHNVNCYTNYTNADVLIELYNKTILTLLDDLAPKSKVTCRVRRRTDMWYDSDCRAAKRRTRKLERRYKRWRSEYARSAWIESLRSQHTLVNRKRNDYWRSRVNAQKNPKLLWRDIDAVLCRARLAKTGTSLAASEFADFFEEKVRNVRAATDGAPPPEFVDVDSEHDLQQFTSLTADDVIKLIQETPDKQSDLDPMPTWLLKSCTDVLAPFLTHLLNVSLSTGHVPALLKTAYITPLLKKPGSDVDVAENYRPVSNLPVVSKLLERAVCKQLQSHLDAAGLMPTMQSAYRKGHSTETALAKVCSDIITAMDKGRHVLLALLDLSAAFDTVDHDILLERLSRSFSVHGGVLDWLRSYLTERYFTVRHGGTESTRRVSIYGVPQGSVLGPLLFVLYTADLGRIADAHDVNAHFYADDSQLYVSAKPQHTDNVSDRLQRCMEAIGQWMGSNRLKLNPVKTDLLWCATRRRQHQLNRNSLMFGGATIQPSSTVRDLGVVLDSEMSFSAYINQLVSRCFYQLRCIKSCVKALPVDIARTIVNSFVISRIDYCNCLLAGAPQYQLNRLQAVMNSAGRLICGLSKFDHISQVLHDRLHWLAVPQRIRYKLCLLVYKALHGLAPQYLTDFCQPVSLVSGRSGLRSSTRGDLIVVSTSTNFGRRSFAVSAPAAWNQLPSDIRNLQSLGSFKHRLKTHLFNCN